MIMPDPHPRRPRAAEPCAPVDAVRRTPAQAHGRHGRDDVRRARAWASPVRRWGSRAAVRLRRRARRARDSWRTPSCRSARARWSEDEGCLSIPGPFHPTTRSATITSAVRTSRARWYEMAGEGLLARIFQHETDHLSGTLFIDHLDDEGRRAVMAELRRIELGLEEPRSKRRFGARGAPRAPTPEPRARGYPRRMRVAFLGNDPWSVPPLEALAARSRLRDRARPHEPAAARRTGLAPHPDRGGRGGRRSGPAARGGRRVDGRAGWRPSRPRGRRSSSWWPTGGC